MSGTPARDPLDMHAILARIDRDLEESAKLRAEQRKLLSESRKFDRDWWVIPFTVLGAVLAAIIARLPEILAAFGVGR
jgi:hypothetical protein